MLKFESIPIENFWFFSVSILGNEFGEPVIVERQIRIMDQPFSKSKK